jgi:hypothetical protein
VRRYLGAVGITNIGQANGTEENGIGFPALGHALVGKRNASFLVMCGAPLEVPKVEADAAQTLMQNIQHLQAGGDDLGADPIAGENRDTEAWSTFHRCCSFSEQRPSPEIWQAPRSRLRDVARRASKPRCAPWPPQDQHPCTVKENGPGGQVFSPPSWSFCRRYSPVRVALRAHVAGRASESGRQ